MASLSLSMIVKDEADYLARCLDSVIDCVDEIVIVDTGSSDQTLAIAQEYKARIYHFDWQNDFSAARNFSLQQCRSDWVLVLDADEYLDANGRSALKAYLQTDLKSPGVTEVKRLHYNDQGQIFNVNLLQRLFSRHAEISFWRPFHECLRYPADTLEQKLHALQLHHDGYRLSVVQQRSKRQRDQVYLENLIDKQPDEPVWQAYLADLYFSEGDYELALAIYLKLWQMPSFRDASSHQLANQHLKTQTFCRRLICHTKLGQIEQASELYAQTDPLISNHPSALYIRGLIYRQQHQFDSALDCFAACLDFQSQTDSLLSFDPNEIGLYPRLQIAHIQRTRLFSQRLSAQQRKRAAQSLIESVDALLLLCPDGRWHTDQTPITVLGAEAVWMYPDLANLSARQSHLFFQLSRWREQFCEAEKQGVPSFIQQAHALAQDIFEQDASSAILLLRLLSLHFLSLESAQFLFDLLKQSDQTALAQQQIREIALFLPEVLQAIPAPDLQLETDALLKKGRLF